ncbi:peptidase inhibitor family I36 protein [Actinomycetota bacterium Odt1-20B]
MAVTKGRVAVATAGALLMLGAGVASAQAGPAAPAASTFARQAESAHLTSAQTRAVQAKVDGYLKKTGGTQVALNKIDLNGKGEILVALPGEPRPRSLAPAGTKGAAVDHCLDGPVYSGYFCAYEKDFYQGDETQMYYCQSYPMNYRRGGSWINDQTPGRRARMYGRNGNLLYTTPPPYSYDRQGDWYHVFTVRPC